MKDGLKPAVRKKKTNNILGQVYEFAIDPKDHELVRAGTDLSYKIPGWGIPTIKGPVYQTVPSGTWSGGLASSASIYVLVESVSSVNYATSTDGATWTARTLPSAITPKIIYNGSIFILTNSGGTTNFTSTDGISWTTRAQLGATAGIAWNGTVFCSTPLATNSYVWTSTDGIAWVQQAAPNGAWTRLLWTGSAFFAADNTQTLAIVSTNGITWNTVDTPFLTSLVAGGDGKVFAINTGSISSIAVSYNNGSSWVYRQVLNITRLLSQSPSTLAYDKGILALSFVGAQRTMISHDDGFSWREIELVADNFLSIHRDQIFGWLAGDSTKILRATIAQTTNIPAIRENNLIRSANTSYVAVTNTANPDKVGRIVQRTNDPRYVSCNLRELNPYDFGLSYEEAQVILAALPSTRSRFVVLPASASWAGAAWNGSVFCITAGATTHAATSTDGISWTTRTIADTGGSNLCWSGSFFFCAGGTTAAQSSTDGISWTSRTLPYAVFGSAATASNGSKICVNGASFVMSSTDAITWSSVIPGTSLTWSGVAYGNGVFCLVSNKGLSAVSTDCISWTEHSMPVILASHLQFNGNVFCVLPTLNLSNNSYCCTSTDGISWNVSNMPIIAGSPTLQSFGAGAGIFIALYSNVRLISSDNGVTWIVQGSPVITSGAMAFNNTSMMIAVTTGSSIAIVDIDKTKFTPPMPQDPKNPPMLRIR